jgi:hypothetical protein
MEQSLAHSVPLVVCVHCELTVTSFDVTAVYGICISFSLSPAYQECKASCIYINIFYFFFPQVCKDSAKLFDFYNMLDVPWYMYPHCNITLNRENFPLS